MLLSLNKHRLIGLKSLGALLDFLPTFGMNITAEKRHLCGLYPHVRQPLQNDMYSGRACSFGTYALRAWSLEWFATVNRPA